MDNKILIGAAVGTGLYFLAAKDKKYTAPDNTEIIVNSIPSLPIDVYVSGLVEINRNSTPDNEWKRAEWSAYFKDISLNNSFQDSAILLWNAWVNPNNQFTDKFPSRDSLIFSLVTYREPISIADNAIFIIEADSVPIYETWSNEWSGVYSWDCAQWKMWYEKNKIKYGFSAAKDKFINGWTYADNWAWVWRLTAGQSCGIDCDFINFFRGEGIDVAITGAENLCTLVAVTTNLIDATESVSETVKNTAALSSYVVPALAIGALAYIVINKTKKLA